MRALAAVSLGRSRGGALRYCVRRLCPLTAKRMLVLSAGGARKFPIHLWKIVPTDQKVGTLFCQNRCPGPSLTLAAQVMGAVVARARVLNMVFTKQPEVIGA